MAYQATKKSITFTYEPQFNQVTSITDPNRLRTITDPAGRTTTFQHDDEGNLITITDPDGSLRQFGYDNRHRLIAQSNKRMLETRYTYDFSGRHIQSDLPDGATRRIIPMETIGLINLEKGTAPF